MRRSHSLSSPSALASFEESAGCYQPLLLVELQKGRAPARPQAQDRDPPDETRRDPDHTQAADQLHTLEHAHHGSGSRHQRSQRAAHLARPRIETASRGNFQVTIPSSRRNWKTSSACTSIRPNTRWCCAPTRRARSKLWTVPSLVCR